jgi:hypothetical protein
VQVSVQYVPVAATQWPTWRSSRGWRTTSPPSRLLSRRYRQTTRTRYEYAVYVKVYRVSEKVYTVSATVHTLSYTVYTVTDKVYTVFD